MPAPSRSVWGRRTANSSPPMRNAGRRDAAAPSSSPKPRSTRSPAAWPRLSLIALNSSRSMRSSAERHLVAQRGRDLAVELLVEGAMVAEPGQRIAQRVGQGGLVAHLEVGLGARRAGETAQSRQREPRRAWPPAPSSQAWRRRARGSHEAIGDEGGQRAGAATHRAGAARRPAASRERRELRRRSLHAPPEGRLQCPGGMVWYGRGGTMQLGSRYRS